ncbi:MAG: hypothetical protein HQK49_17720 [Oligoflexia bacterium]|nr:hypothetical protein [Oligoflexia bacterium]
MNIIKENIFLIFICILISLSSNTLVIAGKDNDGNCNIDPNNIENIFLLGHNNPAKELLAFLLDSDLNFNNINFIKSLSEIIDEINLSKNKNNLKDEIKLRIVNLASSKISKIWPDGKLPQSVCLPTDDLKMIDDDPWMRDFCKIAIVKIKGENKEKTLIIDTNRDKGISILAKKLSKYWDNSFVVNIQNPGYGGDHGGNIEVTANNILYTGENSSSELIKFWKEKGYQDNIVIMKTNWLQVAHVDEQITTIIKPNDPCGMAIVKADPKLAIDTLLSLGEESYKDFPSKFKSERMYKILTEFHNYLNTNRLQIKNNSSGTLTIPLSSSNNIINTNDKSYQMLGKQLSVAKIIDDNVNALKEKIIKKTPECKNIKIVSIPMLYDCPKGFDINLPANCRSLLPGSVNMTVLGQDLIIPDPLYSPFKKIIKTSFEKEQQIPHFIEDVIYHKFHGDVHCATNEFRCSDNFSGHTQ